MYPFFYAGLGSIAYYLFNLKEYYVGEYYLQIVNAVDEGSFIYIGTYLYAYFSGWEEGLKPFLFGQRGLWALFYPITIAQTYQLLEIVYEILTWKQLRVNL